MYKPDEMKLSQRKTQILLSAVEDYIQQASPITSSAIKNRCSENLSTATLRNELSALEAMGFLRQLHTSGGRVPTSKGYRFYVNSLMCDIPLDKHMLDEIHTLFERRTVYLGDMVSEIAAVVSKATNYPTVVMIKGFEKLVIKNIKIIPLLTGQALILIETNSGVINNNMDADPTIPTQTFVDAGNFLTQTFFDHTVADMIKNISAHKADMNAELQEFKGIFETLISTLTRLIETINRSGKVASSGEIKLLNTPEYSDPERAKRVVDILHNANEIGQILGEDSADVSFKIGAEIPLEDLHDCTIAQADYQVDGESIASIGIIGPQRMDYARIAGALKFVVGEFENLKRLTNTTQKGGKDVKKRKGSRRNTVSGSEE